jgi:hypothetical protein
MSARRGLVGAVVAVGALAVAAACSGGLKVDEGNAFPCDYAQAEDVRDTACAPGWRCGIDSRCHEDAPEALADAPEPRYATVPSRLYPKQLAGKPRFIAADPEAARVLVGPGGASVLVTNGLSARTVSAPPAEGASFVGGRLAFAGVSESLEGPRREALLLGTLEADSGGLSMSRVQPLVDGTRALRSLTLPDGKALLLVLHSAGRAGEVDPTTGQYTPFPAGFAVQADGGVCGPGGVLPACLGDLSVLPVLDARPVQEVSLVGPRRDEAANRPVPVVATREFFLWREPSSQPGGGPGTWRVLNPEDPVVRDGASVSPEREWLLRHGEGAGVWALRRTVRPSGADVLSTWVLRRTQQGPRLERAWGDCTPCGSGNLVTFTPVSSEGAPGVEVLCESSLGARSLFRVSGSSVTSPTGACERQPLAAPVDLSELASGAADGGRKLNPPVVDDSLGAGLALAGAHGQLWVGRSLSTLRPLFLDRAPREVAAFEAADAGASFLALTPDFVALRFPEGGPPGAGEPEGLSVVDPRRVDGGTAELGQLATLVRGVQGWLVLESGQLVRVSPANGTLGNSYGPRLLAPSGEPATGPFLGQGMPAPAGSSAGVSLVLTANDQLYVLDSAKLEAEPDAQPGLLPRLTPDPGFPIRSLARDRTVRITSTTGPKVRGWLSTGRGLFEYQQSAEGQWSLLPLPLGNGEPVEVWGREGESTSYGRVGLRDGQVLRLPSGVPLTRPLSGGDFVVDYASLDGWPVALGEAGLYRTRPPAPGEAGLLSWTPLPLPEGLEDAEDLKGARLEVVPEPRPAGGSTQALYLFTRTGFVYRLGEAAR